MTAPLVLAYLAFALGCFFGCGFATFVLIRASKNGWRPPW